MRGAWLACCAVYPYMKKQRSGRSSTLLHHLLQGHGRLPPLRSEQDRLIGLTRCLAEELGPDGITVNTVSPDLIPNPMLRPSDAASDEFVVAGGPSSGTQVPEDMVGTILYLAAAAPTS